MSEKLKQHPFSAAEISEIRAMHDALPLAQRVRPTQAQLEYCRAAGLDVAKLWPVARGAK